jgi:hypothetical protein
MFPERAHRPRRLCVNVDVDALGLYRQIHGLPAEPGGGADPAWTVGVPRFLALFERLGLRATFFVVTRDLGHPAVRAIARDVVAAGHELASHSHTHPYDLVRRPPAEIEAELHAADAVLRALTGAPVAGFRAPGYSQSPILRAALVRLGYRYDSSDFPCPPYVLAKAALIAAKRLRGRRSRSIVARPWESFGRRGPHRLATAGGPLWSFPISVLPGVRFPLIGTSLTILGLAGVAAIEPLVRRMDWLNVELHAADLLSLSDDGLPDELAVQPDLRVPVAAKEAVFARFLGDACPGRAQPTLSALAHALGV